MELHVALYTKYCDRASFLVSLPIVVRIEPTAKWCGKRRPGEDSVNVDRPCVFWLDDVQLIELTLGF